MTQLGHAANYLRLCDLSAKTHASRASLLAAGIGTAYASWCHPASDNVATPLPRPPPTYPVGMAGTCCADGPCRSALMCRRSPPGADAADALCLPIGGGTIDNALADVDATIAKVTCWESPLLLPTDEGDVDITKLLGAGNVAAAIDGFGDRLEHNFYRNEHRLYLSSDFDGVDDGTIDRLRQCVQKNARDACIELNANKKRVPAKDGAQTEYSYLQCFCKHGVSDGKVSPKNKEYGDGGVFATNVSQGRKDQQTRDEIQRNGSRGHKCNSLATAKCTMTFAIKYDSDKSRWYVTVGSGCPSHVGHKKKTKEEMIVKKKSVPKAEKKILEDLNKVGGTAATARRLLYERTGLLLSDDQINNLFRQVTEEGESPKTPAELAIEFCESEGDVEYIAIYHRYDTPMLTANTSGRRFKKTDRFEVESSMEAMRTEKVRQAVDDAVTAAAAKEHVNASAPMRSSSRSTAGKRKTARFGQEEDGSTGGDCCTHLLVFALHHVTSCTYCICIHIYIYIYYMGVHVAIMYILYMYIYIYICYMGAHVAIAIMSDIIHVF